MEPNQAKLAVEESSCGGGRGPAVRTICVFCGSRPGNRPSFSAAALDLGKQLVERQLDLVYGGGSGGLMGLVSKTVHDGGRHVLGVIPSALLPQEVSGETFGEVKVVRDMHERKWDWLNVDGYYNSLLSLFDKGVEEGFIDAAARTSSSSPTPPPSCSPS
ncbi:hypothetical protein GUJ93_ZPchr0003g18147 [Zizania palustris]|uniref:cytokinin riboside 5'-monophosphate phosphoribohydrolase n=1 Tax=Zizania palustris TaxID=103762 RepID=A0A8J5S216_ZIZPA|nr:hypothetical protein GUJ93_ZPchr0003g18147 [Zizania palustris]